MLHDVFISYSSRDKVIADAVCHFLEQGGIKCWIAPRDIAPGFDYADMIEDAIHSAKLFVIIFSDNSANSQWVKGELNLAFTEQIPIIPFKIDTSEVAGSNKLILNKTHWIDAYPKYEAKLDLLVHSAQAILNKEPFPGKKNSEEGASKLKSTYLNKAELLRLCKRFRYIIICVAFIVIIMTSLLFLPGEKSNEPIIVNNIEFNKGIMNDKQIKAITSILEGMIEVKGGAFIMGNPEKIDHEGLRAEDDKLSDSQHTVFLDDFLICEIELTQGQLEPFIQIESMVKQVGAHKPLDYLSWDQCVTIVDTLRAMTGINFDLPTEAQWEYAARGGLQGICAEFMYSGSDDSLSVGWILSENSLQQIHEGKGKKGNELGLYDMTGNVAEWCKDAYSEYPSWDVSNPCTLNGDTKIIRGGSVISDRLHAKVYTRAQWHHSFQRSFTGMRLVINKTK